MRNSHGRLDRIHLFALRCVRAWACGRRRRSPTVTKLLEQGDKLADAGKFTEAVIRYKSGMEKLLPDAQKTPVQA